MFPSKFKKQTNKQIKKQKEQPCMYEAIIANSNNRLKLHLKQAKVKTRFL